MIWTIGHSTRTQEEFLRLLTSFGIRVLVDVRSLPGSRKFPHFNRERMEEWLPESGIEYRHLPGLGGRRKGRKDSHNTGWRHPAFQSYADYMETPEFAEALGKLEQIAAAQPTAIMCSEALWWRCHRSLISDALKLRSWQVLHIMGPGKASEHDWTSPARVVNGRLGYEGTEGTEGAEGTEGTGGREATNGRKGRQERQGERDV